MRDKLKEKNNIKTQTFSFLDDVVSLDFYLQKKNIIWLSFLLLLGLTLWSWSIIVFYGSQSDQAIYFLDVGQGDSQLIVLNNERDNEDVKILIDGGRDSSVLSGLDEALGKRNDKYIDIVAATHGDADHIGGLIDVLRKYEVGVFVSSGRENDSAVFQALKEELLKQKVQTVVLDQGDRISYQNNLLSILLPDENILQAENNNEASLVFLFESLGSKALFVGDIGIETENYLLEEISDLDIDILKVGHHGSKYSSGENFISALSPSVSVIGVGDNRFGHPAPRVLETLDLVGSEVYRTDLDGNIKVTLDLFNEKVSLEPKEESEQENVFWKKLYSFLSGAYKEKLMSEVSLKQALAEERESLLVPYETCSFDNKNKVDLVSSSILINELAWMGAETGATHEWIELKNISGDEVDLSGWQLLNKNERVRILFPQQFTSSDDFVILARKTADENLSLNADLIFTGALRNSDEGLRLFDNQCNLIDEVLAVPSWPAGDNESKQTMERMPDLSWASSVLVAGTPDKENTQGVSVQVGNFSAEVEERSNIKSLAGDRLGCLEDQINVNSALKQDLIKIDHIGPARAEVIIQARPFVSLSDMASRVTGLGDKRLADILDQGLACVE